MSLSLGDMTCFVRHLLLNSRHTNATHTHTENQSLGIVVTRQSNDRICILVPTVMLFFKKKLEHMTPFRGATDIPVWDF